MLANPPFISLIRFFCLSTTVALFADRKVLSMQIHFAGNKSQSTRHFRSGYQLTSQGTLILLRFSLPSSLTEVKEDISYRVIGDAVVVVALGIKRCRERCQGIRFEFGSMTNLH